MLTPSIQSIVCAMSVRANTENKASEGNKEEEENIMEEGDCETIDGD